MDVDEGILREIAGPMSLNPPRTSGYPGQRSIEKQREFDAIDEMMPNTMHSSWLLLRATRVARITRWSDTQIGDETYTDWVWH